MKQEKWFCDRCGSEEKSMGYLNITRTIFTGSRYEIDIPRRHYDCLCKNCIIKIINFIENKEENIK